MQCSLCPWIKEATLEQRGQGTLARVRWTHTAFTFTPPRTYNVGKSKCLVPQQAAKAPLELARGG